MIKGKKIIMCVFLCIVSFLSIFPLYWMVCAATNKSVDVARGRLYPGTYFIENFKNLIGAQNIGRALGNSFKYAIVLTLISLVICSLAGYGFEIYHDKGKDAVMSVILLAMMVPFVATLIPLFQMFSKAGWLNTTIGFILPTMRSTYAAAMTITFMNAWNNYLWSKVIMTDDKSITMPMVVANLTQGYVTDYGVLMIAVLNGKCKAPL